jgi:hypothetical protein
VMYGNSPTVQVGLNIEDVMNCFFCGKTVTEEFYCEDCTTYICEDCGKANPKRKNHGVHAHLPKARRPS